jgi:hypothetical protein
MNGPGSARFNQQMANATHYSPSDLVMTSEVARCRGLLPRDIGYATCHPRW